MAKTISWLISDPINRNLRALSFSLMTASMEHRGLVTLRLHYYKPPSTDEFEAAKDLEAELYAQTPDEFDYAIEAQVTPIGTTMDFLPHIAWTDGAERYRRK